MSWAHSAQPGGKRRPSIFGISHPSGQAVANALLSCPGWKRAALQPIRIPLHGGYLLWIRTKNKALAAVLPGRTPAGQGKQCSQRLVSVRFLIMGECHEIGLPPGVI